MSFEYRKLKGRIIEIHGNQETFAKVLGLSSNTISRKLNNKADFSKEDIKTWCEALRIDITPENIGLYFFA